MSKGQDVRGIDADPVNQRCPNTGFGVSCLNLLKEEAVDHVNSICSWSGFLQRRHIRCDTGASTFIPLWHYILENHALDYCGREANGCSFIRLLLEASR